MRSGRTTRRGWRWVGMLLIAGALPLGAVQPAQAAPVDLVNPGTRTFDRWGIQPGDFFAFAFEATGTATATSAKVLFLPDPAQTDLFGSKVSICTGYPAAPADSNACFGSMNYASMAADATYPTLKWATFTGSIVITPGTYWFKVHDVPAGPSRPVEIRHGDVRNSGIWNVPSASGVINWAAQYPGRTAYTKDYGNYTGKFTLSGDPGDSNTNGSGAAGAPEEEPVNRAVMQQYARAAGEPCPAGWGDSWAQWPHGYSGGHVCSRTVRWDHALHDWVPA